MGDGGRDQVSSEADAELWAMQRQLTHATEQIAALERHLEASLARGGGADLGATLLPRLLGSLAKMRLAAAAARDGATTPPPRASRSPVSTAGMSKR